MRKKEGKTQDQLLPLWKFRAELADVLCRQGVKNTNKRGRPSPVIDELLRQKRQKASTSYIPPSEVRKDAIGHFAIILDNRQRCKNPKCGKLTSIKCDKCGVFLCFNKNNNCFKAFHT